MKRLALLGLLIFLSWVNPAAAQIAFVNAADLGNNGGAGPGYTVAYTDGGNANTLFLIGILGGVIGTDADDITSVTWNSISASLIAKLTVQSAGSPAGFSRFVYLYGVLSVAPPGASRNVVITAGTTHYLIAGISEYQGVRQSGLPDAVNAVRTDSPGGTVNVPLTTAANNCWTFVMIGTPSGGNFIYDSGTVDTLRAADAAFASWKIADSGNAVTPAGTAGTTFHLSIGGADIYTIMISVAPVGGVSAIITPGPMPVTPFGN